MGDMRSVRRSFRVSSKNSPQTRLSKTQELLLEITDDFVDNLLDHAVQLAKHRGSDSVEPKDVLLHLERHWDMHVPGFGGEEVPKFPFKRGSKLTGNVSQRFVDPLPRPLRPKTNRENRRDLPQSAPRGRRRWHRGGCIIYRARMLHLSLELE